MMRCVVGIGVVLALAGVAGAEQQGKLGSKKTAWDAPETPRDAVMKFGDDYIDFISANKTERAFIAASVALAEHHGFRAFPGAPRGKTKPGDRFYVQRHGKILALIVIGSRRLLDGVRIVGAHIDAVRIDLKQNPLYEDGNLALLETHYYGGIKKYQWLSLPLALHGVVLTKDGRRVDVKIGDDPKDPVLVIPDILKHLHDHAKSIAGENVRGEALDPIVGSIPDGAAKSARFKGTVQRLLRDKYGIEERDFRTAELSLVPAYRARSVGLDGGLVGGYGQDDRACGYVALRAALAVAKPVHTAVTLLVDKEGIGSSGNTGTQSNFLQGVVGALLEAELGPGRATEQRLRDLFQKSKALSTDVTSAVQPHYAKLWDKKNANYLGSGPTWDQSGVHSEFMLFVRQLLERNKIPYQTGDFARVFGGRHEGGTILPFLTRLGLDAMNFSIPLISMHAPFELTSKVDLYWSYRAYAAFLSE
ncbi:MAG: aminopeptidase [Deltaproteobacteria bacterium]|nr:aminopeptidase [Deltaproteobacteria bacterium]